MEFLKELFKGGSLTYEQLAEAAKGANVSAVNGAEYASKGEHVKKTDYDALNGQLGAANATIADLQTKVKAFDGVDVNALKLAAETVKNDYEKRLNGLKLDHAVENAVNAARARDYKSVAAHLDTEKIKLDGERLLGLDDQIADLKKSKSFLFEPEPSDGQDGQNAQGGVHTHQLPYGGQTYQTYQRTPEHGAPLGAVGDAVNAFKAAAGLPVNK